MVTFSKWRPDGGYDYYEAEGYVAPLGDDLPDPRLTAATELGVPSVEVGHPLPAGARHIGEGELAVGIVAPMDMSWLGSLLPSCASPLLWVLVGGGLVGVAWALWGRRRR